jgi:hypothetical protein
MVKGIKETIVIIWKDLAKALMVLEIIIMRVQGIALHRNCLGTITSTGHLGEENLESRLAATNKF